MCHNSNPPSTVWKETGRTATAGEKISGRPQLPVLEPMKTNIGKLKKLKKNHNGMTERYVQRFRLTQM